MVARKKEFVVYVISFVNRVVIRASFTLISVTFIEPVVSILLVIIVSVCILLTSIDADFITDDLISLVVLLVAALLLLVHRTHVHSHLRRNLLHVAELRLDRAAVIPPPDASYRYMCVDVSCS